MKNNLILGLYCKAQHSACMASLETENGLQTGVLQWTGFGIASALHQILQEAQVIKARRLMVLCNHQGLVGTFTATRSRNGEKIQKIALALPDVRKEGRRMIPCGNENMWNVARDLCRYESWRIVYLENLPKSKELWDATFRNLETSGN